MDLVNLKTPVQVIGAELGENIRVLISEHFSKVSYCAMRFYGNKAYLIKANNHKALYSFDLKEGTIELVDDEESLAVFDNFKKFINSWPSGSIRELINLLKQERSRFKDLV